MIDKEAVIDLFVVVTEAIRDEGTSNHYLRQEVKVESSPQLRKKLTNHLNEEKIDYHEGPVWTTDGVYRETRGKFRKFKSAGVLAVNMETSAVFALSKFRGVDAASAQVISDILSEPGWLEAFGSESVAKQSKILVNSVLDALSNTEV